MRRPEVRQLVITRVRQDTSASAPTSYFTYPGGGRGRSRVGFIRTEHVPDFDGERALVEAERVPAKPWPYWRVVRVVEVLPTAAD
jgi:hypothetical protein